MPWRCSYGALGQWLTRPRRTGIYREAVTVGHADERPIRAQGRLGPRPRRPRGTATAAHVAAQPGDVRRGRRRAGRAARAVARSGLPRCRGPLPGLSASLIRTRLVAPTDFGARHEQV